MAHRLLQALDHKSRLQRNISQLLVELLIDGNKLSFEVISRLVPPPLLQALAEPWTESDSAALRKKATKVYGLEAADHSSTNNWPLFFTRLRSNTERPTLVWNSSCVEDLLSALDREIVVFDEQA